MPQGLHRHMRALAVFLSHGEEVLPLGLGELVHLDPRDGVVDLPDRIAGAAQDLLEDVREELVPVELTPWLLLSSAHKGIFENAFPRRGANHRESFREAPRPEVP